MAVEAIKMASCGLKWIRTQNEPQEMETNVCCVLVTCC